MSGENTARTAARLGAVQALYQMETAGTGVETVIREFNAHRLGGDIEGVSIHDADAEFFADIARGVIEMQRKIDPVIERRLAANWKLQRIDATARAILRAGVYELSRRADIPYRVVIDEYVELANAFFDGDEPRFINAVLDAVAREARKDEIE
jgi:N utilization substance protein B